MIIADAKDLQGMLEYIHTGNLSIDRSCEIGDECAVMDRDVPIIVGYLLNVTEARYGDKYLQVAAKFPTKKSTTLIGWKCAINRLKISYRDLPRGVRISQIKAVMTCDAETQKRLLRKGVAEDLGQEELMALVKAERGEKDDEKKETVESIVRKIFALLEELSQIAPPNVRQAAGEVVNLLCGATAIKNEKLGFTGGRT